MYAKLDLPTGDVRWNSKPKKRYELSLKKIGNIGTERNSPFQTRTEPKTRNESAESEDSQNFRLRLSESFVADDTRDETREKIEKVGGKEAQEIIVISDSSDEGTPDKFEWMKHKTSAPSREIIEKSSTTPSCVYIVKSSDSEDNDERYVQSLPRNTGKLTDLPVEKLQRKCSIAYTSDEDSSEGESEIYSNRRENVFYRSKEKAEKSRETASKYFQDSEKKITSLAERFGDVFRNENAAESESGVNGDKREDLLYGDNDDRDNRKKFNPERFAGHFNDESRRDADSGISSTKRGNFYTGGNKENNSRSTRIDEENEKKLLPSTERLRGILTENSRNTDSREIVKNSPAIGARLENPKRTPLLARILAQRTPGSSNSRENPEESHRTPTSAKISSHSMLAKKAAPEIPEALTSKQKNRESPKSHEKFSDFDSENENRSTERSTPEVNIATRSPIVIAETDSDSDEKVTRGSRVDDSKPRKTHVTRFLDPAIGDAELSDRKKLEVAKWLLTSAADSRSGDDDSLSDVPGTQGGNTPSSGNSSLERFEENHETPNNRGKMRKLYSPMTTKTTTAPNSTRTTKTARQTTIDNFVMRSEDGTKAVFTPINNTASEKRVVKEKTTGNLGIMDCADILDNLYGNVWRDKADHLLPASEPRKPNIPRRDKAVQTERKVNPRSRNIPKKTSESSSNDDEFDAFVRDIRPNLNSTKKPATTTSRRRCSFIRDSPSSGDSGGETTYLTALTNPRISNNLQMPKRPTPGSLAIQKARAICDSDTEDEIDDNDNKGYDYRKQLSFSDDEDSHTSEYDPSDEIPSKTSAKTAPKTANVASTPRDVCRPSKVPVSRPRIERTKSFLASLCATVPLHEAHPDARKFRQNFKTTKDELCKLLYRLYNDKVFDNKLPKDMSVEWNVRMRGTAGFCYNKRSIKALGGVTRSSRIVLATKILDTPDRLRDTLVHEMCHAAAWLINEISDGHGPFWKGWASKAMKAFPELPPIRRCHDYKIQTKFTYRCTGCGYSVGRHSKSLDVEKKRCGHCYGKFELLVNKVTKSGTVEVRTPTARQPTGFALFVKENYHSVKKDRKGAAHKEVMQILGQQFSAIKITKRANNSDDNNSDGASGP